MSSSALLTLPRRRAVAIDDRRWTIVDMDAPDCELDVETSWQTIDSAAGARLADAAARLTYLRSLAGDAGWEPDSDEQIAEDGAVIQALWDRQIRSIGD